MREKKKSTSPLLFQGSVHFDLGSTRCAFVAERSQFGISIAKFRVLTFSSLLQALEIEPTNLVVSI